jgi:HSP20 family protein
MSPPDPRKRRDDDPFGDIFADFDKEFRRMQEMMNGIFEQALKNAEIPKGQARPGNPFVVGFTMRLGPDGRPHFEQFGNTPRVGPTLGTPTPGAMPEGREPITDVIEHDDKVTITVELPGVEKDDIQVWATEERLTLKVDTAQRKYGKEVALPARVKPGTTEATFKNGVLDVSIQKERQGPPRDPGHRVNVK